MPTVSQLFIFPVKSLRGIAVKSAQLTPQGLHHDRSWMIINHNNNFVTQRQLPQMILINTHLTESSLVLQKEGSSDLEIPLESPQNSDTVFTAKIWKDLCEVIDEGEAAGQWLTQAIGSKFPLRLVRMAKDHQRPQSKPHLLGDSTHTLFADAAPYLICNTESLNNLNQHLVNNQTEAVPIERFRPNIVVEGLDAFAENQIHYLAHEHYRLKHCYPCERCIIPTIDIETGIRHPQQQPFSLIAEINPMPNNPRSPAFGQNAILEEGDGMTIAVGDLLQAQQTF